jgi:hypothetical protein
MSWGILETLGSVTVLMVAIPPAFAGAGLLLGGNLVGVALLGVALAMVAADQYITTPGDLPVLVVSKLVGVVARPPDEEQ